MAQISPLSLPTSTTLRSSLILPTLPQILSELVQNSLDAGASRIDCCLDLTKHGESVRVEDDGCGINEEGLKKVGKRFRTSKRLNGSGLGPIGSYGFRGEALASIGSIALLDITTRAASSKSTYVKIFKSTKVLVQGPTLNRHIPSEGGTIVVVRDIFHNIPVRREELATSNSAIMIIQCRKVLERFCLGCPGVDITLWEEGRSDGTRKVLGLGETKSRLDVFRALYGNALVQRVQNIRVSSGKRRVDGFISLYGDVSKAHQHLYVNNSSIDRRELHLAITKKFAASKFAALVSFGDHDVIDNRNSRTRRSPRRLERHPIYVLNVTLPAGDVDAAYEPRKHLLGYRALDSVKALLLAVVDEYLKRNGLASMRAVSPTPSPTKMSQSGTAATYLPSPLATPRTPQFSLRPRPEPSPHPSALQSPDTPGDILFGDHVTRDTQASETSSTQAQSQSQCDQLPVSKRRRLNGEGYEKHRINLRPSRNYRWIEDLRRNVNTGVLPTVDSSTHLHLTPDPDMVDCECESSVRRFEPTRAILFREPIKSTLTNIRFSEESLSQARIVGQVDKKYVATILRTTATSSPSIVLIDQHAADERIAIERILRQLCDGFSSDNMPTTSLEGSEPIIVFTRAEAEQLSRPDVSLILGRWGIVLKRPKMDTEGDYVQVQVDRVPSVLAARLGNKDGTEMTRLLRGYLPVHAERRGEVDAMIEKFDNFESHEEGRSGGGGVVGEEGMRDWRRAMRFMPKEMLELANSKACRGAIMFEDRLTPDQCFRLVDQLSATSSPFICAHGRPVLAPLVVLTGEDKEGVRSGKRQIDWGKWKQRAELDG
ncbi:hypothetical protein IAR55_002658 [Kwoniella newhampshirensis]|uniref:MutL C-terminal dimerisation domain-containing protein n=1 Tax=Kwoniella newhampshirensis TaxID=1651941 RepID=A0AAW0YNL4_9TREE